MVLGKAVGKVVGKRVGTGPLFHRQDRLVGNRVGQGDRALVPKNVTDVLDMLIVVFFWDKGPVPAVLFLRLKLSRLSHI